MLHVFAEVYEKLLITAKKVVTRGAAPAETWGPQEILAHITAWESEAFQRIPLLAIGASDKTYDADLFNAGAVAAIRSVGGAGRTRLCSWRLRTGVDYRLHPT